MRGKPIADVDVTTVSVTMTLDRPVRFGPCVVVVEEKPAQVVSNRQQAR
jgi:hypothetical protein